MKEDTRVDGPWTSEGDEAEKPMPWDIALIKQLRPWQQKLLDISKVRELRQINVILDRGGNSGKTTFQRYMLWYKHAQMVPFCNDYKDLLRMVMDMPKSPCYMMDMPRAIKKDKLGQLYSAIETIKGGYAFDDRYHFKQEMFDPPVMMIFTNYLPDFDMLTADRWVLWKIVEDDLVRCGNEEFENQECDELK